MPQRNVQFVNQQFYHVFNRGTEKRIIFQNHADYLRFYVSLCVFNDPEFHAIEGIDVNEILQNFSLPRTGSPSAWQRSTLVNAVSFCLMPNHFHLLLEQNIENGIPAFMHRLCSAYSKYFNKRNDRTGRLFEGPFKAVHMKRDAQFEHLPRYIHLNALDLTDLNWRDGKIDDWGRAEKFLEEYPWSSHNVYLNKPQQLPVVEKSIMGEIFNTPEKYMRFLKEWSGRI